MGERKALPLLVAGLRFFSKEVFSQREGLCVEITWKKPVERST